MFVPAHYAFVDALDLDEGGSDMEALAAALSDQASAEYRAYREAQRAKRRSYRDGQVGEHPTLGQCSVCGAHLRYAVVWAYQPGGEFQGYVTSGEDCAGNIDAAQASAIVDTVGALRDFVAVARKRLTEIHRVESARDEFLAASSANRTAVGFAHWFVAEGPDDFEFVSDVFTKYVQSGGLSDRQVAALNKIRARHYERETERAAEASLPVAPCPAGTVTITGEVLSVKAQFNRFSPYGETVLKMTVRDDRGFRVWGTVPRSLETRSVWNAEGRLVDVEGVDRGDRVSFVASVAPSDDDETFGFYKRPRGAELLAQS